MLVVGLFWVMIQDSLTVVLRPLVDERIYGKRLEIRARFRAIRRYNVIVLITGMGCFMDLYFHLLRRIPNDFYQIVSRVHFQDIRIQIGIRFVVHVNYR